MPWQVDEAGNRLGYLYGFSGIQAAREALDSDGGS